MPFWEIYMYGLIPVMVAVTILWLISIKIQNVSIIDIFWGLGFVLASIVYFFLSDGNGWRKLLVISFVIIWGLRLSGYLAWRNLGKAEDYRYREFRKNYGEHRYWWFSFFQVFLLQGFLIWLVSAPLLAAMYYGNNSHIGIIDGLAAIIWMLGFVFEAGGDYQLARFKANPDNKGKVLQSGLWKYTRHPNYFGDTAVWWGFALFSIAAGSYWPVLSAVLMTALIVKVSGVAMVERTIDSRRTGYNDYRERTSAFFPWIPKRKKIIRHEKH